MDRPWLLLAVVFLFADVAWPNTFTEQALALGARGAMHPLVNLKQLFIKDMLEFLLRQPDGFQITTQDIRDRRYGFVPLDAGKTLTALQTVGIVDAEPIPESRTYPKPVSYRLGAEVADRRFIPDYRKRLLDMSEWMHRGMLPESPRCASAQRELHKLHTTFPKALHNIHCYYSSLWIGLPSETAWAWLMGWVQAAALGRQALEASIAAFMDGERLPDRNERWHGIWDSLEQVTEKIVDEFEINGLLGRSA